MPNSNRIFKFGLFTLSVESGELVKRGRVLRLQEQPFQILVALLEKPGHLVSRADLQARLWPNGTFVDFDNSINNAVNRLRTVLGDSARTARFIETVGRRGYRFVGTLTEHSNLASDASLASAVAPVLANTPAPSPPPPSSPLALPTADQANGRDRQQSERWGGGRRVVLSSAVAAAIVVAVVGVLARGQVQSWLGVDQGQPPIRRDALSAHSLAVLPMKNAAREPDSDYFAYGMMDALIAELTKLDSLRVVSPYSDASYRHESELSVSDVGRELNVDTILQGSVSQVGDARRVNIKIFAAKSGKELWAGQFEQPTSETLALRSQILSAVVREVQANVTGSSTRTMPTTMTSNAAAYNAYVRGQFETLKRNPAALEQAATEFELALALDSNFAPAHAGLAWVHLQQGSWAGKDDRRSQAVQVKASISRAMALDPNLAEAHTALGLALQFYDYDWVGSEAALRRAIQLKPSSAPAHNEYAILLSTLGRFDEALAEANRTLALDPRAPVYWVNKALAQQRPRRYSDAEVSLRQAVKLDPTFWRASDRMFTLFVAQRRFSDARQVLQDMEAAGNARSLTLRRAQLEAASGGRQAALRLAETITGTERLRELTAIAGIHATIGDSAGAYQLLDQALKEKLLLVGMLLGFEFDSLRSDRRFLDILRATGLSQEAVIKYRSAAPAPDGLVASRR